MVDERLRHRAYTREHGDDPPDVRDWVWPGGSTRSCGSSSSTPARAASSSGCSTTTTRCSARATSRRCAARTARPDAAARAAGAAGARRDRPSRSCTAARASRRRPCSTTRSSPSCTTLTALAPLHQPPVAGGARRRRRSARCPACRRSRASTPRSTRRCPTAAATYALPARVARALAAAPLRLPRPLARATSRGARRSSSDVPAPSCGSSAATSARAHRLRDRRRRARSTRRWASRRSRGSSWRRARGSVDPGLLLWLLEQQRHAGAELADALEHESGLPGSAGTRRHARGARAPRRGRRADATLALDVYVHRLRAGDRRDGRRARRPRRRSSFTGGVGERAAQSAPRRPTASAFLGVALDAARNDAAEPDTEIGAPGAAVRTLVDRRARGPRDRPAGARRTRGRVTLAYPARSAARAAASPGTPCTAPPGNVAALPRNSPRSGVRYGRGGGQRAEDHLAQRGSCRRRRRRRRGSRCAPRGRPGRARGGRGCGRGSPARSARPAPRCARRGGRSRAPSRRPAPGRACRPTRCACPAGARVGSATLCWPSSRNGRVGQAARRRGHRPAQLVLAAADVHRARRRGPRRSPTGSGRPAPSRP